MGEELTMELPKKSYEIFRAYVVNTYTANSAERVKLIGEFQSEEEAIDQLRPAVEESRRYNHSNMDKDVGGYVEKVTLTRIVPEVSEDE